ncbi:MAG: hypothetical protein PHQ19_01140 [Candidatus Krumholzibacteria bacterium]|nr:hypothetical protein [Candidatus Krumholzibacteria bacterium]
MEKRLESLRSRESRVIVGIEAGGSGGRLGAVLVEVSGSGDDTVLELLSARSAVLPAELQSALASLGGDLGAEGLAQVNFLILHQINSIFFGIVESAEIDPGEVDLIGLKGIEAGGREIPDDPGALSELTGCIVASCFRIGPHRGIGHWVPVKESILRGMVAAMVERYDLDEIAREAVAVALLANESVYHEAIDGACPRGSIPPKSAVATRTVRRVGDLPPDAALHGEFFFPAV